MAATESFMIVNGPPQHMLERALLVRDEGIRRIKFTIVFEPTTASKIAVPVTVATLSRYAGSYTSWVVGGLSDLSDRTDYDEHEVLTSAMRWLKGNREMPYYRAYYDSRTRQGYLGFASEPLISEPIFDRHEHLFLHERSPVAN
jgi:hypothetical protein